MKMFNKINILVIGMLGILSLGSCGDDDDNKMPSVVPSSTGTVVDRDGNEYKWVRIADLDWMTENLRCDAPFYEDTYNDKWVDEWGNGISLAGTHDDWVRWYADFGNYYTWQEAMDNAPEGWRLPTDEDFKALERELGMKESDLDKEGWRNGASFLMSQSEAGTCLNFKYGGEICYFSYNTGLYHPDDYGYYWTATDVEVNKEPAAYARMITPGKNAVNRLVILQERHYLNVRYVRDAK